MPSLSLTRSSFNPEIGRKQGFHMDFVTPLRCCREPAKFLPLQLGMRNYRLGLCQKEIAS
jgi:hypothetical protein